MTSTTKRVTLNSLLSFLESVTHRPPLIYRSWATTTLPIPTADADNSHNPVVKPNYNSEYRRRIGTNGEGCRIVSSAFDIVERFTKVAEDVGGQRVYGSNGQGVRASPLLYTAKQINV